MREAGRVTRKIPSHEQTYARVRDMILFGQLAPGQPVTIQGLVAELGAGMTPVREAIRRLSAEGALTLQGNRRVSVPQLTLGQLEEVTFARLAIEPRLVEIAAPWLDGPVIEQIATADRAVDEAIETGDIQGYLEANHRFHFMLYGVSGAEVLLGLARALWLRFGPSLRVVCAGNGHLGLPDRHRDALSAMRRADTGALAEAIRADIRQGADRVAQALKTGEI